MSICTYDRTHSFNSNYFFQGLSLALRTQDQIPASHWSSPLHPPPIFFYLFFFFIIFFFWGGGLKSPWWRHTGVNTNITCLQDFFSNIKLSKKERDINFLKYFSKVHFDNFIVKYVSFDPKNCSLYFLFCYKFHFCIFKHLRYFVSPSIIINPSRYSLTIHEILSRQL